MRYLSSSSCRLRIISFSLGLILLLVPTMNVSPSEVIVYLPNGMRITKQVTSMKEARFKNVVQQKYDISCGAAALATILKYYYKKEDISEEKIILDMFELGDKEKIKKQGFSLLEMKRYVDSKGYLSGGYKVPVNKLSKLKIPSIVLLDIGGYKHFVVLKGISEGRAIIADPALGNKSMAIDEFDKAWNNILFVVLSNSEKGYSGFIKDETLRVSNDSRREFIYTSVHNMFSGKNEF